MDGSDWVGHYLDDCQYILWIRPWDGEAGAAGVEVQAVEVVGWFSDEPGHPEPLRPYWVQMKGWKRSGDDTVIEDREGSDLFFDGSIKWDGCSDIDFSTGAVTPHFCGMEDAVNVGLLLEHTYRIAALFYLQDREGRYFDADLYYH